MANVTGVTVEALYAEESSSPSGENWKLVADGTTYEAGMYPPKYPNKGGNVAEGDIISFAFESSKYGNKIDYKSFARGGAGPTASSSPAKSSGNSKPAGKAPAADAMSKEEWAAKDRKIVRQSMVKAASEVVARSIEPGQAFNATEVGYTIIALATRLVAFAEDDSIFGDTPADMDKAPKKKKKKVSD